MTTAWRKAILPDSMNTVRDSTRSKHLSSGESLKGSGWGAGAQFRRFRRHGFEGGAIPDPLGAEFEQRAHIFVVEQAAVGLREGVRDTGGIDSNSEPLRTA